MQDAGAAVNGALSRCLACSLAPLSSVEASASPPVVFLGTLAQARALARRSAAAAI
jgi:hypothetical protein